MKIQMLEVAPGMRPGMSATVDIVTENREQQCNPNSIFNISS